MFFYDFKQQKKTIILKQENCIKGKQTNTGNSTELISCSWRRDSFFDSRQLWCGRNLDNVIWTFGMTTKLRC